MKRQIRASFILILAAGLFSLSAAAEEGRIMSDYLLLDDFSGQASVLNTEWEGFTDQVMGGVSEISVLRAEEKGEPFIRMQGDVSLRNNGGFIQIRLKLARSFGSFDGSEYQGIRLQVRGEGSGYYLFIRTTATTLPWKYYAAPVPVSPEWSEVLIPWSAFLPGDYGKLKPFQADKLKSLALAAYGREFRARIDLKEIGFY